MAEACPIPTPEQRRYAAIEADARAALLAKIHAALDEAAAAAAAGLAAVDHEGPPPAREYFAAVAHQHLYCLLCGADPETFAGGKPEVALALIRSARNIARHHWGADIPPDPIPAGPNDSPHPAR